MAKVALPTRILCYRLFYLVVIGAALLDRLTKWIIQATLPYGSYDKSTMLEIIPGFFYICHIGNTGAAWGLFHGRSFMLALFSLFALVLLYFFRHTLGLRNLSVQFTLGLVTGGIIGNLYDRMVIHYVVDFLDFHLGFYRWPAFNIADSSILIGVLLFIWHSLREESAQKKISA